MLTGVNCVYYKDSSTNHPIYITWPWLWPWLCHGHGPGHGHGHGHGHGLCLWSCTWAAWHGHGMAMSVGVLQAVGRCSERL